MNQIVIDENFRSLLLLDGFLFSTIIITLLYYYNFEPTNSPAYSGDLVVFPSIFIGIIGTALVYVAGYLLRERSDR